MGRSKRRRSKHRHYGNVELLEREKRYSADLIHRLSKDEQSVVMEGHTVEVDNLRIQCFREKGLTCAKCGIEACFAALELVQSPAYNGWAINFYAHTDIGDEVIFTKDHIHPRSRGGGDEMANLQPMCWPCNQRKGNSVVHTATEGRNAS